MGLNYSDLSMQVFIGAETSTCFLLSR